MTVNVYTLSDLHIDYRANFDHLLGLNHPNYANAALIIAGDTTDDLSKLAQMLRHFKQLFAEVFFVPGNHELWVRNSPYSSSLEKFSAIRQLCQQLGVHTSPYKFSGGNVNEPNPVWIVPLFSWYTKPEEGPDTLFATKPGDDQTDLIWSDNQLCHWHPLQPGKAVVDYFLGLNEPVIQREYDAPVISFSHFLPLQRLVFAIDHDPKLPRIFVDPLPEFNFSRVAGTSRLDAQIRQCGSTLHIHGHQHRNRHRDIDGVTYISHCLGYPQERQKHFWRGDSRPKHVWHNGKIPCATAF